MSEQVIQADREAAARVTNPLWAHEELQGSDFKMVRACGACLWSEASTLREATRQLEADKAELVEALEKTAKVFRRYQALHRNKGTREGKEKAEANRQIAVELEATLAKHGATP